MISNFLLVLLCLLLRGHDAKYAATRIIGGEIAYDGGYPFIAAINVQTSTSKFFCGGTILTNDWILTAGQCVDGAILFTIQLGSNTLEGDDVNRVTVATSTYVLHPDYNPETLDNDIGIIQLRIPVKFTPYISSVEHIALIDLPNQISAVAIGWGQISDETPGLVNDLYSVDLATIPNEECKIIYGNQITDNMVCVVGNYNEGTCIGDSGGPLIQYRGYSLLVAVASFVSANGCESTDPSGYTRIPPYAEWMANITSR